MKSTSTGIEILSIKQNSLQPSPAIVFPSSHCSPMPCSTIPLPHTMGDGPMKKPAQPLVLPIGGSPGLAVVVVVEGRVLPGMVVALLVDDDVVKVVDMVGTGVVVVLVDVVVEDVVVVDGVDEMDVDVGTGVVEVVVGFAVVVTVVDVVVG